MAGGPGVSSSAVSRDVPAPTNDAEITSRRTANRSDDAAAMRMFPPECVTICGLWPSFVIHWTVSGVTFCVVQAKVAQMNTFHSTSSPIIAAERPDARDALALITELHGHLETLYPPESQHGFSVERLIAEAVPFFVLRAFGQPAGCGGIKLIANDYGELKRMYVRPRYRGNGFGKLILGHLTEFALAHEITLLRLETGIHQQAAIRLYQQAGFSRIPPFGPYTDDPLSLCYEKRLLETR
jgi:GNAT superfamily N-acetyltransferase